MPISVIKTDHITTERFLELSKNNPPIIIDIRDKEKFDREHILNAINLPLFNLQQKKASTHYYSAMSILHHLL